ncbi:MAG: 4Fe-4S ferredoxin, partial [Lachnospiraceae bacterium]|nr:4Fe-4S ferredoxin [Lachnospiraceae bacterium]
MKRIKRDAADALFKKINEKRNLLIPVKQAGVTKFAPYFEGAELSDDLLTVRSAKDLFFPQVEDLAGFRVSGKAIEVFETREEVLDFAVFGVRACDARSFEILDRVFLKEPEDTYYRERREHAVIITLACGNPEKTCFCSNFGIDAAAPGGDVECIEGDEYLYWRAKTDKGEALTAELSDLLEEAGDEPEEFGERQAAIRGKIKDLPLAGLDLGAFGCGKTKALFDSEKWDLLSEACL